MKLSTKITIIISVSMTLTTVLIVSLAYEFSRSDTSYLVILYLMLGIVTLPIAVMIFTLYRLIARPVQTLTELVNRIALGDLSGRVTIHSNDEFGQLGNGFNEMTWQLSKTYRELQAAAHTAQEEQARLESSINGLRQAYILVNTKCEVLLLNTAAAAIIKDNSGRVRQPYSRNEFDALMSALPQDLRLEEQVKLTMQSQKPTKFSNLAVAGRFLNLYLSPVIVHEAIGCVILLEDVTEERIIQRSRDEFFSIASHELRTPLTAIRGNASILQQYYPEAAKQTGVHDIIDDIHESAIRLIAIVNDFLDTSRLEQDKVKFTLTAFPIDQTIEKVIYEMGGQAKAKKISLLYDQATRGKLPLVYADSARITQVLYNLVGNAMKYTDHGKIMINAIPQTHHIKICVSDTGAGISAEGQQLLFHKFQQSGDSLLTRDSSRGTGLGLYISRLLVKRMHGDIKLEHSEIGKGTTFSFTVPIASKKQLTESSTSESQ